MPNKWGPNISTATDKPCLAISRCLLGDRVRYDGKDQCSPLIVEYFSSRFNLIPVCPEVEIGLGVPRPPVELTGNPKVPRLTGRDEPLLDITPKMSDYCQQKISGLQHICGYIFKSRSPSCGLRDAPVHQNRQVVHLGAGFFTRAMQSAYPDLPMKDELQLQNRQSMEDFSQQLLHYYQNKL